MTHAAPEDGREDPQEHLLTSGTCKETVKGRGEGDHDERGGVHANEDRLRRYGIVSGQRMTGSPMDDDCFSGTAKIEARRKLVVIP